MQTAAPSRPLAFKERKTARHESTLSRWPGSIAKIVLWFFSSMPRTTSEGFFFDGTATSDVEVCAVDNERPVLSFDRPR